MMFYLRVCCLCIFLAVVSRAACAVGIVAFQWPKQPGFEPRGTSLARCKGGRFWFYQGVVCTALDVAGLCNTAVKGGQAVYYSPSVSIRARRFYVFFKKRLDLVLL